MPIPTYQDVMKPILEFCSDGKEVKLQDLVQKLADNYSLTDEERNLKHEKVKLMFFMAGFIGLKLTYRKPGC